MSDEIAKSPVIEMRGVHVATLRDPSFIVLEDVNWSVGPGQFWVVAGPPHSGKTDLLIHAAGLISPVKGTCRILGHEAGEFDETRIALRRRIGLVFADGRLFSQLTLAENIALPLRYHHEGAAEEDLARTVAALLDLLELTPYANLTPGNAAMVWRQRAALGRALALKPDLLLLDNPNGGLIERHRRWLVGFLDRLWRGHDFFGHPMTIVVTTDDLGTWQHLQRQFAAVHEGTFTVLGPWGCEEFGRHKGVMELLAIPAESKKIERTN